MAASSACALACPQALAAERSYCWQGAALGADAAMTFVDVGGTEGRRLAVCCLAEIQRLERIFSLFVPDSALRRLNSAGRLTEPPAELIEVLEWAHRLSELSEGAFDVSIQPLWQYLYYQPEAARSEARLSELARLVDYRAIRCTRDEISFDKPGMQITLNGVAQGYITDQVSRLLKGRGLRGVLVELGETYALGANAGKRPWRIGIRQPGGSGIASIVELEDRAIATSGGYGTPFDGTGNRHHLIDARRGSSSMRYGSVSVLADSAVEADGLSTALSLIEQKRHAAILREYPGTRSLILPRPNAGQPAV